MREKICVKKYTRDIYVCRDPYRRFFPPIDGSFDRLNSHAESMGQSENHDMDIFAFGHASYA